MDFLTDNIKIPSLLFLNCEITKKGIIPEIGFFSSGKYAEYYDMYDKEGLKCCQIRMPDFLIGQSVLLDQCFFNNSTEFILTKVYD
jgi:hypothetical protein